MKKHDQNSLQSAVVEENSTAIEKKDFIEPKLLFVSPKLTRHGDVTKITQAGFFGMFSP